MKVISLYDGEEDCSLQVSIDPQYTGILVYCKNHDTGDKTSILVDDRLMKQLCNDVSKAIRNRARKTNECGEVTYA